VLALILQGVAWCSKTAHLLEHKILKLIFVSDVIGIVFIYSLNNFLRLVLKLSL